MPRITKDNRINMENRVYIQCPDLQFVGLNRKFHCGLTDQDIPAKNGKPVRPSWCPIKKFTKEICQVPKELAENYNATHIGQRLSSRDKDIYSYKQG